MSNLSQLKSQLQYVIPAELYQIEPGQIVCFVPAKGMDQRTSIMLMDVFRYFRRLHEEIDININIIPTTNELLVGTIAYRNANEKVVVGTTNTIAGFAADYFDEDVNDVVSKAQSVSARIGISSEELPVVVEIDPKDCPKKEQQRGSVSTGFTCPFMSEGSSDMGLLIAKPEKGSKKERELIEKAENNLEKILRNCAIQGIELDIEKIRKKVADSINNNIDYKLIIKSQFKKNSHTTLCLSYEIYVAEGDEYRLDLTAIEKAVYLTFLLYEDGIKLSETFGDFREIVAKIYGKLPAKSEKIYGGIRDPKGTTFFSHLTTLRSYTANIRTAVSKVVSNPIAAPQFCIEGFKDSPCGIEMTTPEIRAKIKEDFKL